MNKKAGINIILIIVPVAIAVLLIMLLAKGGKYKDIGDVIIEKSICRNTGMSFNDYEFWMENYFETHQGSPNLDEADTKLALDFCTEALWCFGKTNKKEFKPPSTIKKSKAIPCCFEHFGDHLEEELGASYEDLRRVYGGECS